MNDRSNNSSVDFILNICSVYDSGRSELMVNGRENAITEQSSNCSFRSLYVLHINTLRKGMNPLLPFLAIYSVYMIGDGWLMKMCSKL